MVPQGDIKKIICDIFKDKCNEALLIAACESGFVPTKVNYNDSKITGYNSYGLFQINGPDNWQWHDPTQNTLAAYDKFKRRGWQPWTNCKNKNGLA